MERTIFHIDANSAFLSWTAVDRITKGIYPDLRDLPSVIGGDINARKGIVLAKSMPAKPYNIKTGEPLYSAKIKCPNLEIVSPNFKLYEHFSQEMYKICNRFSPSLQCFSIDELFLDYTNMEEHFGSPIEGAQKLSNAIKNELGFTVNIGISTNKLLAKMASDFEKPDKIHTLYPNEVKQKMWHLPVSHLFMVGRSTTEKLKKLGITTIGQLANCDKNFLEYHFKSHGNVIWCYANGKDLSIIRSENEIPVKSIGNGTTTRKDILTYNDAYTVLLALSEKTSSRLRNAEFNCGLIEVALKSSSFNYYSHQQKLFNSVCTTNDIYSISKRIFNEMWKGEPLRALNIRLGYLTDNHSVQCSFYDQSKTILYEKIDNSVDKIRQKYGYTSITRGSLLNNPTSIKIVNDQSPAMTSVL